MSSPFDPHSRSATSASVDTAETATVAATSPQASKFAKVNSSMNGINEMPEYIPPEHPYRTLVLCFDGTGDQFDSDNSNVVEFFSMLKKDDPDRQLVYYQAGIGTYTVPQIATPLFAKFSKTLDEMIAWNMDAHIMGGYEFLMQNHRKGDKICIFGFSRGAYIARCLAGMIHKVGLLPICNHQQVPFAYKMYTRTDDQGWYQSNAFKKAFSIDVDIEFLGVWDTVSSVGLIPRRLPFTTSNTLVRTFRHAVALDEHRAKFQPNLWNRPNTEEEKLSITDKQKKQDGKKSNGRAGPSNKALENKYSKERGTPTDIDEVWFAGSHCDVGGGSVTNGVKPCLARIPLRWMVRECFKSNSGILFHTEGIRGIGLDPAALYPIVLPRPPALDLDTYSSETALIQSIPKTPVPVVEVAEDATIVEEAQEAEELLDLKDVLGPIYDQLSLKWFWWVLELFPMKHRYQKSNDSWSSWFGWNLGAGRHIPRQEKKGVRVHRSVRTRLAAEDEHGRRYTPKANLDLKFVTWVD